VRNKPERFINIPACGEGGIVITPPTADWTAFIGHCVALQADGKILATSYRADGALALTRYLPDGTLDIAFRDRVLETTPFRQISWTLAIQQDGKIVVGGQVVGFAEEKSLLSIMRYQADGSLDTAFGEGGRVMKNFVVNGYRDLPVRGGRRDVA
jgi:uncharacterized delta-60 repeat protein